MEQILTSKTQHNLENGNICSNNKRCGGFGAMMASLMHHWEEHTTSAQRAVAAASAVLAPAKAAVAPFGASGTKNPPPVADAKRTWLTKCPYKRQKKTLQPAAMPAPTAAPTPALLLGSTGLRCAHLRRRSPPPSFLLCLLRRRCPCGSTSPSIHVVFSSRS
jgi:hypothetical protein